MTISVVIPAYNEAALLGPCLDSLMKQTRRPDEIIVVDNNSTDVTAAVAVDYGVRVLSESRQGIMPAVYAGFSASSCDIIARCDADSILPVDWIASIHDAFEGQPSLVAVTGPGVFYDTNRVAAALAQVWYMYAYFIFAGLALANWPLFGSNCAIRRNAWQAIKNRVHKTRIDIHDDMDMSVHLRVTDRIQLNPRMRVRISARSLKVSGLRTRYSRGFTTLLIHWPENAPWQRWAIKLKSLIRPG